MFLDPSFLYGAGILVIREHLTQKLAFLCLRGFSRRFGPKWRFLKQNRESDGEMLTPNELFLTFGFFYLCATFGENRSRNATVRVRTDRQEQTEFIICPILYAIVMGQIKM